MRDWIRRRFAAHHQSTRRLYQEGQEGRYENRLISLRQSDGDLSGVLLYVSLTTGERAIVSVINSGKLHQPIVTITHDPSGQPCRPLVIDLANQDAEAPPRGIRSVLGTIPTEFERSAFTVLASSRSHPAGTSHGPGNPKRFGLETLFVAQCFDPVESSGFVGGIESKNSPTASENTKAVMIASNEMMVGHPAITVVIERRQCRRLRR